MPQEEDSRKPKNPRVRPKKKFESDSEEESESDEELPQIEEKKRRALKRKKTESPDPHHTRKRIISNDDSGSESGNEERDFDIIRIPEKGRYNFRPRRYAKPKFRLTSHPSNLRIKYGVLTKGAIKNEQKLNKLSKKFKMPIPQVVKSMGYSNAFRPPSREIVKRLLEMVKERRRKRAAEMSKDEGDEEPSAEPSEPVDTTVKQNSGENKKIEITEAFEIAQYDHIEWTSCNDGVEYFAFVGSSVKLLINGQSSFTKFFV